MFRKLEEDKIPVTTAAETPDGECVCACKLEKADAEPEVPAVDQVAVAAAIYFEING